MIEAMLGLGFKQGAADNSDIPFPAGTPFKGIKKSADFIYGDGLAALVGLSSGAPMNVDGGWLHFIEDSGLEVYIAKKPIRYGATREQIMDATDSGAKEVTIRGEVYICRLMSGAISTGAAAVPANAGGEWNRYMYNVYDNTDRVGIESALIWGDYTRTMLGLGAPGGTDLSDGVFTICAEALTNGFCLRGNDWQNSSGNHPIMGIWNMPANNPQTYYGWRPILVKKSSIPPTPFRGEVAGADLITASALATELGITGTVPPDANPTWLKFVDNGKTLYIAKKPMRTSVLWETLNTAGAVKGGKIITIGGNRYAVRLMTGGNGADPTTTGGGEYDAYFSRVTVNYPGNASDRWANYSNADVDYQGGTGSGELTLCQEMYSGANPLTRGYPGFSGVWYQQAGATHGGYGWRPVLELIGPSLSDTWVQLATLPEPLNGSSAVVINGKMYVFGGQDAAFAVKGSLYEIDCVTGAVVAKQGSTPRRYHTAVAIGGKMVVYGGYASSITPDVVVYDPATNTWSPKLNGIASDRHAAVPYANKMYVFGGNNGGGLSQARTYDPTANTWANFNTNPVSTPLAFQGGAGVQGDNAYVAGGFYNQKKFSKVNLLTGVVTAMADIPFGVYTQAMTQANGGVYSFGGIVDVAGKDQVVMRYEIVSNTWITLGAIPYTIKDLACAASDGTNIYLAGGKGSPTAVWKYTP
jgi:hypothetical protein